MPRKRHQPEEIVAKLRQVDVLTSQAAPLRTRDHLDFLGTLEHLSVG
jgi:hypothetical protein